MKNVKMHEELTQMLLNFGQNIYCNLLKNER